MSVLGSHNAWTFLPVKRWWMKPLAFTARCQNCSIMEQYNSGSRCFDLRVRFDKEGNIILAHGFIKYKYSYDELLEDLTRLNGLKDCSVRILHEVRTKRLYTPDSVEKFKSFCKYINTTFTNIKFWCGRNLYNWDVDYEFSYNPSCEELYASVCLPTFVDDWWPWLYAFRKNKSIIQKGTDKDILLIDFVNYGH